MALPGEFAAAEACQAPRHHPGAGKAGVLCSCGVMEGRCPAGAEFGLERLTGVVIAAMAAGGLASEELCLLIRAIVDH